MNIQISKVFTIALMTAGTAFVSAAQAQENVGESYRAIGTGKTCESAKDQARHSARVWRNKNCPVHQLSAHSSEAGFSAQDSKGLGRPDDKVICMQKDTEFYVYRDVTCVAAR